jgi:ABC-2 type transport system ATP-binding protein
VRPVAGEGPATIEVDGLVKSFGGRPVLRDVTFRVESGETFALLGPNGAGKTTTVEIVEGYRRADGGRVRVLGRDPLNADRDHRARVGLMLQGGGGVDPRLEAREVLWLYGRFHTRARDPEQLLALVGLEAVARNRFRRLSGGEKQRLGLALALVGRPQVLCLDEPTAGMDVEARAQTRALLGRLRGEGVTILLTSHDLGDVERLADQIAIIDRGRIVAAGSPAALSAEASPVVRFSLTAALSASDRALLVERLQRIGGEAALDEESPGQYVVTRLEASPEVIAMIAAWCSEHGLLIRELRAGGGSLEDRYLALTGAAGDEDAR